MKTFIFNTEYKVAVVLAEDRKKALEVLLAEYDDQYTKWVNATGLSDKVREARKKNPIVSEDDFKELLRTSPYILNTNEAIIL